MKPIWVLCLVVGAVAFSCKDQNNKDVDWFSVYKMPIESADNSTNGIKQGIAWYYTDVNLKTPLTASAQNLDSNQQAIAYTLQQFYDRKTDSTVFHAMYNDEPYNDTSPDSTDSTDIEKMLRANRVITSNAASVQYGHSKGVVFFDGTSGIWLVHSVPKFPPPDHYEYPQSGHDYGQTMLCLTFNYDQLELIGTQMYYNHPDIYSSQLPTSMAADNPNLAKVIGGSYKTGTPYSSIIDLKTKGGATFRSFAKNHQFNTDLYDGLVAPMLKTNLIAETWRRGSEVPLSCNNTYFTLDAQHIQVGTTGSFKYTKDHSKFARSTDSSKPYVCIGDINRMTSQYVRGGGTECISSDWLWNAFNVILDENSCPV